MHTWFHVQLDQKILDGLYSADTEYITVAGDVKTKLDGAKSKR